MKKNLLVWILFLAIGFTFHLSSCKDDPAPALTVSEIAPESGLPGLEVTISGTRFSAVPDENKVTFNGVEAEVVEASPTRLIVIVPDEGSTGPVAITRNGKSAVNQPVFTYVQQPPPVVDSECETGKSVDVQNFRILRIRKEQDGPSPGAFYYSIDYEFELINTGSETLDLSHIDIQNYISLEGTLATGYAGGGLSSAHGDLVSMAKQEVSSYAGTYFLPDPLDIDGKFLIAEISFPSSANPTCYIVLTAMIKLK